MAGENSKTPSPPNSPKGKQPDPPPVRKSNTQPASDNELADFLTGLTEATEEQKKLLTELYLLNGQDAYDAEAAAVGRLKQEEYLALPNDFDCPVVPPKDVGRAATRGYFKARDLAAIYALNKRRAPVGENAVIYGMVRMEAVKMGWVHSQKEIIRVERPAQGEALAEFVTDLSSVRTQLEMLRLSAFLVPLVCEHTFRTMGHHYITGLATEYQARYRNVPS